MLVASVSMNSREIKKDNVSVAIEWIEKAAEKGASWVLLPEMFSYFGSYDGLYENAEFENSPLLQLLADTSKRLGITLFAGTIPLRSPDNKQKVYNTALVFSSQGEVIARYDKCHLFNLKDSNGKPLYCESDGYLSGGELKVFQHQGFSIGMSTCYDIRFPQFYAKMTSEKPVDVLVVPAAFTLKTGMAHWELLLKARAVENQCYVIAANQNGQHGGGKESYGHSMIIDP